MNWHGYIDYFAFSPDKQDINTCYQINQICYCPGNTQNLRTDWSNIPLVSSIGTVNNLVSSIFTPPPFPPTQVLIQLPFVSLFCRRLMNIYWRLIFFISKFRFYHFIVLSQVNEYILMVNLFYYLLIIIINGKYFHYLLIVFSYIPEII